MAKALNKWVNLGIIKEEEEGGFVLLEMQEEGGVKPSTSRQGTSAANPLLDKPVDTKIAVVEEAPSVMTVEQQQAEQMKVYWRVCVGSRFSLSCTLTKLPVVHRRNVDELGITSPRSYSNHASDRSRLR